ncbi:DEAD/DEAH box helicase family protein [Ideonella sp. 4Y16]|uniref:DEAD/DEAH box helicase family protein n=1 Tax=Ideonella alba TaxID=2824118 RepID=A0A941BGZ0_9BURK|nr:DEAD/DEAH box helicase family protein [Ideonella alba]MBQ0933496.1 DEAD/DEAH box helicase family protein [Ideonella alba]MBQ0945889.1 DEAD/DEAH box helicase family protein [Ideonella alba]
MTRAPRFAGWGQVADALREMASTPQPGGEAPQALNEGQRRSLRVVAERLVNHGLLVADEVGMGKTRIAVMTAKAVIEAGGRVAVLIPPGLGYQWVDEFKHGQVMCQPVLRSLRQYLDAWAVDEAKSDDPPAHPWASQNVLLVSHSFTNWRLGAKSEAWRWVLLPELYAHWRAATTGRLPNGYHGDDRATDDRARRAAADIVRIAKRRDGNAERRLMDELIEGTPWKLSLEAAEYAKTGTLRHWLEQAVGLGLGHFDLVIIDEAHKSRGEESGLTRLLDQVILAQPEARRLGMTATPIELAATQWHHTLQRIGVAAAPLEPAIRAYAEAVEQVRALPAQAEARHRLAEAAQLFHAALSPYVLRRDKREAESVIAFQRGTGLPAHAYREHQPVLVPMESLSAPWARALCAAEALSLMGGQVTGAAAQRLRLSLGSGHGLSAVLDAGARAAASDEELSADADPEKDHSDVDEAVLAADKTQARVTYWLGLLRQTFDRSADALYEHPGLRAAIQAIEAADAEGEKVLVFGRFTRPMEALARMLNARALLRHLDQRRPWAQSTLDDEDWHAVQLAHRDLGRPGAFHREALQARLGEQYKALENTRERLRDGLARRLSLGLAQLPPNPRLRALQQAMERDPQLSRSTLAAALHEHLGPGAETCSDLAWAQGFEDLINALCDRDEGDRNRDGSLDDAEVGDLWANILQRLHDEYDAPTGSFARLMRGSTSQPTRRLLQLAFNRAHSFPRVLVAQSIVGREGLNLHRACRTVLLLHPEWNPGVVEQQIGRVDRVGSHWEQMLHRAQREGWAPEKWPRIRVWPLVFQGTYDEYNWQVLLRRWDDLRSQLHGVILPDSLRTDDPQFNQNIDKINALAPSFSPSL